MDKPVPAPLSEFWTVEYHFNSDSFSVRPLPDYLTLAQTAARDGTLFDSVILALHPTSVNNVGATSEKLIRNFRQVCVARPT